jgi:hypothetical protein
MRPPMLLYVMRKYVGLMLLAINFSPSSDVDSSRGLGHSMGMLRISEGFSVPFQAWSPLGLSHMNCRLGIQGLLQLR